MTWSHNLLAAVLLSFTCAAQQFYVSPSGHDDATGSKDAPFGTLEKARDAARKAKVSGSSEPITIWLYGGDYFRTNALELTTEDSGTPEHRAIWRAVPGQLPRFLGAVKLHQFHSLTDASLRERLRPEARDRVLQADLAILGIGQFGTIKSRGFARPTQTAHSELFYAGKPMTLARWPNAGSWTKITGFPQDKARPDGHGGKFGDLESGFTFEADPARSWHDTSDIWVHGYWAWDWANSYEHISAIDTAARLVKTAPPYGHYGFRKGQRVYFLNILEELDSPGEWYLDRNTAQLYFWPPDNRVPSSDAPEVLLSLAGEPFLWLNRASFVTFDGVAFEGTRATAIEISGGSGNVISNAIIRNIGNWAVGIHGGINNGVSRCSIINTGDGGVSLEGGNRQDLTPGGNYVEHSHFQHQGRWSKCYVPAILMEGVGQRASRNLIHDHPHCAILYGGNDHLIELNEIHSIALETGDVGAIYTGRDYTFRGNRIRFNYIHNTGGVGMGSMGVYMDDCVSGTEIFGNIFYKVHRAVFLGGGRDHLVANNIFVNCDPAIEMDGRGVDGSPVWRTMVDATMRERIRQVPLNLYRKKYPEMKSLDAYYGAPEATPLTGGAFKGVPPENNVVMRNICVGKWLKTGWHANSELVKVEANTTNAPFLLGTGAEMPEPKSFELANTLGAKIPGFQRIPIERIGPQVTLTTSKRAQE